ncbi:hypothetical protein NO2_0420 [Candidatus Termititenax persephonae]|uniref:Uncharacterized protein n=1 Tax=Candidatus Termititenax persephonae TaxID=2218525 RepID=A0A388TFF2_9BACT|nr:hypothetical protein NO2_0420 [Candidatus Termititenax persephonae]
MSQMVSDFIRKEAEKDMTKKKLSELTLADCLADKAERPRNWEIKTTIQNGGNE